MDKEIELVLESGENLQWEGRINRAIINLNLIVGLLFTVFIVIFITFSTASNSIVMATDTGGTVEFNKFIISGGILALGLFINIWSFFSSLITRYVVTSKRILIKTGIIGRDFKSIYYEQIRNSSANVGLIDKIFGVGTLKFDTGELESVSSGEGRTSTQTKYTMVSHIDSPYEVYKIVQGHISERKESLYSGRADQENINRGI